MVLVFYLAGLAGAIDYRRRLSSLAARSLLFVPAILLIMAVPANLLVRGATFPASPVDARRHRAPGTRARPQPLESGQEPPGGRAPGESPAADGGSGKHRAGAERKPNPALDDAPGSPTWWPSDSARTPTDGSIRSAARAPTTRLPQRHPPLLVVRIELVLGRIDRKRLERIRRPDQAGWRHRAWAMAATTMAAGVASRSSSSSGDRARRRRIE